MEDGERMMILIACLKKIDADWVAFKSDGDEYHEGWEDALSEVALDARTALRKAGVS